MSQDLRRAQRRQKSAGLHSHLGSWMGGDPSSEHSPHPLLQLSHLRLHTPTWIPFLSHPTSPRLGVQPHFGPALDPQ